MYAYNYALMYVAMWLGFIDYCSVSSLSTDLSMRILHVYNNAKQKHPRCKKNEAKSEAPGSFNSCTRLESVISGGGQGPSCLLATMKDQLHI